MKWHKFGPGCNQLRLCIVIVTTELESRTEQRAFLRLLKIKQRLYFFSKKSSNV
jgi:hypothetical protein